MTTNNFRAIIIGKETFHPLSFNENEFVMNYKLEKGGMVPPHFHIHMDEHFAVVKGKMKFKVAGKTIFKNVGEEIMVPKGIVHSIANAGEEQVEMVVKYMPDADTSRTFAIISALDEKKPGSMINLLKAFYIGKRLGLKEFSTPSVAFVKYLMDGIITISGKLSGWDKLIAQFK